MKLDAATRGESRGRLAESGGFEMSDGDAEVRAVREVEDLRAEDDTARLVEVERLDEGEVHVEIAARPEGVAADLPILTQRRAQRGEVVRRQTERLAPVGRDFAAGPLGLGGGGG